MQNFETLKNFGNAVEVKIKRGVESGMIRGVGRRECFKKDSATVGEILKNFTRGSKKRMLKIVSKQFLGKGNAPVSTTTRAIFLGARANASSEASALITRNASECAARYAPFCPMPPARSRTRPVFKSGANWIKRALM